MTMAPFSPAVLPTELLKKTGVRMRTGEGEAKAA